MRFYRQAFYNPGSIRLNVGRLRRLPPPAASELRSKDWTTVGQSYAENGRLQEITSGNRERGHRDPRASGGAQGGPAATQLTGSKDRADPESSRERRVV